MTTSPMMLDYYNDNDPAAAEWLRTLMVGGHIPPGRVDGRSILDVSPDDLAGVRRAHFFAGIAGWSEALRLADWPDSIPVWTGSPPCQPFSPAGKGLGRDDPRHLGPRFIELVRAGRPPVLFGEQVASSDVFGPATSSRKRGSPAEPAWAWIDDLFDRLEAAGYAAWALDIPAAGVGAPHIRQRCFFAAVDLRFAGGLADNQSERWHWGEDTAGAGWRGGAQNSGATGGLGDCLGAGLEGQRGHGNASREPGRVGAVAAGSAGAAGVSGGLANADGRNARAERKQCGGEHGQQPQDGRPGEGWSRPTNGFWGAADWLACRDGSWRPAEPIDERMAYGVSIALDPSIIGVVDASTSERIAAEAMRAMREGYDPAAIWAEVGGCVGFPAASVLLAVLCQHTGELGQVQHRWPTSGEKDRIARHLQQVWLKFCSLAGPPSGRGFSEQLARQLGNSLPKLPRKGAPPRWRALTMLTAGPLAENVSGRVGLLRGYGNAIVPQVAAEAISIAREVMIEAGIWDRLEAAYEPESAE